MSGSQNIQFINHCVNKIKTRKLLFTKFNLSTSKTNEYTNIMSLKRNVAGDVSDCGDYITSKVIEKAESLRDVIDLKVLKEHFEEFLEIMKDSGCCYVIYDFGFYNSDGAFRNTICLISFVPDNEPTKEKFTYSSNSLTLKGMLEGVGKLITVNAHSQLTFSAIENACQAYSKF